MLTKNLFEDMKNVCIICIMLLVTSVVGNAQRFVESNFGVKYEGGKSSYEGTNGMFTKDSPSSFAISSYSKVGYQMSERIAVGLSPYLAWTAENYPKSSDEEVSERNALFWRFSVFGRFNLLGSEKFSVFLESSIYIGGAIINEKTGTDNKFGRTMNTYGVSFFPAVSYDLSEKFSIVANCDFLRADFYTYTIKTKDSGSKMTTNKIDFNAISTSSIFDYLMNVSIGLMYKF